MSTVTIGRVMPLYKGTYSNGAKYEQNDVVFYEGATYWHKSEASTTGITCDNTEIWGKVSEKGDKGDKGDVTTIISYRSQYQASETNESPPTGQWYDEPPAYPNRWYLWSRLSIVFTNGSTAYLYSVARNGIDGSGAVSSVCNLAPDANGNIRLTATDILLNSNTGASTIAASLATKADLDAEGKVKQSQSSSTLMPLTSNFTITSYSLGKTILAKNSPNITITLPASTTTAPIGSEFECIKTSTGNVTFKSENTSVSVKSIGGALTISEQYGCACAKRVDASTWVISGCLS